MSLINVYYPFFLDSLCTVHGNSRRASNQHVDRYDG